MRMERRLGQTARRIRKEAGLDLIDIEALSGVSQPTLSRFEQGDGWRRETNRIVAAYARVAGITSEELWFAAIETEEDA